MDKNGEVSTATTAEQYDDVKDSHEDMFEWLIEVRRRETLPMKHSPFLFNISFKRLIHESKNQRWNSLISYLPGAMAAKAYTHQDFSSMFSLSTHTAVYAAIYSILLQQLWISELKRLNDCYIVGVGEDHDIQLHVFTQTQDEMKDSFEASLLSFKNILDEFDKKLTDIAEKLDSSFESGSVWKKLI
ncbi:hypothetical protein BC829DRAFT_421827 [Chytridium lagenaria]|nr:hypothetical protein BC829DRAFT_421827 [Chytridium lagenaria]